MKREKSQPDHHEERETRCYEHRIRVVHGAYTAHQQRLHQSEHPQQYYINRIASRHALAASKHHHDDKGASDEYPQYPGVGVKKALQRRQKDDASYEGYGDEKLQGHDGVDFAYERVAYFGLREGLRRAEE